MKYTNFESRESRIETKRTVEKWVEAIVEAKQNTNRPSDTAEALVEALGYKEAVEAVAVLVEMVGAWDGRISRRSREWADAQTEARREALNTLGLYQPSAIHPAHIDQLTEAMAKYQPTEEPEAETVAEAEPEAAESFPELRRLVKADAEKDTAEKRCYIENGYFPTWAEEHRTDPDRGLKAYSTAHRWEQYQAGEISREKAVELATKRALKEIEKDTAEKLDKLDRVAAAPDLTFLSISVEWVRSRTWGHNLHVEARTSSGTFSGSASGCGYDKESAAIASALNQCRSVLKALYTLKEQGLKEGQTSESRTTCTGHDNRNICGYGAGYGVLPAFEGGVGSSCFWSILKKCGFSTHCHSGKHSDFYSVEKEVA